MPPQTPASLAKSWLMTWGPQFAVKLFLPTAREDFVFRANFAHEKTPLFTKTCRSLSAFFGWQIDLSLRNDALIKAFN